MLNGANNMQTARLNRSTCALGVVKPSSAVQQLAPAPAWRAVWRLAMRPAPSAPC